jgi:hypothetical protein
MNQRPSHDSRSSEPDVDHPRDCWEAATKGPECRSSLPWPTSESTAAIARPSREAVLLDGSEHEITRSKNWL